MALAVRIDLGSEAVVDPVPLPSGLDDPGRPQHGEVPRGVGLRQAERLLDVADAEFVVSKEGEYAKPSLIAQGLEKPGNATNVGQSARLHNNILIFYYCYAVNFFEEPLSTSGQPVRIG